MCVSKSRNIYTKYIYNVYQDTFQPLCDPYLTLTSPLYVHFAGKRVILCVCIIQREMCFARACVRVIKTGIKGIYLRFERICCSCRGIVGK